MRTLKLALMLLREVTSRNILERRPEPTQLMDDPRQVEAFHEQGTTALIPIYHFNAMATSQLAPVGSTVVDLGSGSGQYLAYLAERRPDLKIIGIELAPTMVDVGMHFLERRNLLQRVSLRVGDMTTFASDIDAPVSVVSSVFSLHHLPTTKDLSACLSQIQQMRARTGSAIWIFDHARPRHPATPDVFPELFTPTAPISFNTDSRNSLNAAYSFDEMMTQLAAVGLAEGHHWLSRLMRLYQVHSLDGPTPGNCAQAWRNTPLSSLAKKEWKGLQWLFPALPRHP